MKRTDEKIIYNKKYTVPSIGIGILYSIGAHYHYTEGKLGYVSSVILILIRFFIVTMLVIIALNLLDKLFDSGHFFSKQQEKKRELPLRFCIFMLIWTPLAIIKYPGAMCWSTWSMLYHYRNHTITTQHSVLYSVVLGKLVDVTSAIGKPNIGLFLFVLMHLIIMSAVFSYACMVIKRLGVKPVLVNTTMLIWLTNPYIVGYVGVAIKDVLYAAWMVVLTSLLIEIQTDQERFFEKPWKMLLLGIVIVLSILTRNNGIYLAAFILAAVFVKACKKEINRNGLIFVLLSIILAVCVNYGLISHFNVTKFSIREALSVPFQQTARYVKYHGGDVTEDEREAIDAVLDYDNLPSLYNPEKSDNVKSTYKGNNSALPKYFLTWLAQFGRHPVCYFSAYCEQYHYLFVPEANIDNIALYRDVNIGYERMKEINIKTMTHFYEDIFSAPEQLEKFKGWIIEVFKGLHYNYLIGGLANISINVYILILLLIKLIEDKMKWILPFSVAIVALMFAMVGPAIYGHPRYLFPIVWSMPVLFFYSASLYSTNQK